MFVLAVSVDFLFIFLVLHIGFLNSVKKQMVIRRASFYVF